MISSVCMIWLRAFWWVRSVWLCLVLISGCTILGICSAWTSSSQRLDHDLSYPLNSIKMIQLSSAWICYRSEKYSSILGQAAPHRLRYAVHSTVAGGISCYQLKYQWCLKQKESRSLLSITPLSLSLVVYNWHCFSTAFWWPLLGFWRGL